MTTPPPTRSHVRPYSPRLPNHEIDPPRLHYVPRRALRASPKPSKTQLVRLHLSPLHTYLDARWVACWYYIQYVVLSIQVTESAIWMLRKASQTVIVWRTPGVDDCGLMTGEVPMRCFYMPKLSVNSAGMHLSLATSTWSALPNGKTGRA